MRYHFKNKEESRARILDSAAKQFRAGGVETVRVADACGAGSAGVCGPLDCDRQRGLLNIRPISD